VFQRKHTELQDDLARATEERERLKEEVHSFTEMVNLLKQQVRLAILGFKKKKHSMENNEIFFSECLHGRFIKILAAVFIWHHSKYCLACFL